MGKTTSLTKQEQLDRIKADIIASDVCRHLADTATQMVFGEGSPDAEMVFIGEAPGRQEDEQGRPFVGASGKFLAEMLAGIGLKREQVYITNIVKYRPPHNRDPLPDEKTAFLPYLLRQIEVIKPRLVITLGRHSGALFLPNLKIGQDHGQPKRVKLHWHEKPYDDDAGQGSGESRTEVHDVYAEAEAQASTKSSISELGGELGSTKNSLELVVTVLPLYHPAAALYNGYQRQTLIDDFGLIPRILETIKKK